MPSNSNRPLISALQPYSDSDLKDPDSGIKTAGVELFVVEAKKEAVMKVIWLEFLAADLPSSHGFLRRDRWLYDRPASNSN